MTKKVLLWHATKRAGLRPTRTNRLLFEPLEARQMLAIGPVVISEFLAADGGDLLDADDDSSDWIELYNPTDARVSLGGWYLTDDAANLTKWQFPNVRVEPGEYQALASCSKCGAPCVPEESVTSMPSINSLVRKPFSPRIRTDVALPAPPVLLTEIAGS